MAGYSPLYIKAFETGLVQSREEFILPDDAYPVLQNAYVWRERIKRKQGYELLGRLQRNLTAGTILSTQANGATYLNVDILANPAFNLRASEPDATITPGSVNITVGAIVFLDTNKDGNLTAGGLGTGTINYATGRLELFFTPALAVPTDVIVKMSYNPNLPVMGIRLRELESILKNQTVFFDTKYAYIFDGITSSFEEFLSNIAATWTGTNSDFFWSTNYWVGTGNRKIFWVTNYSLTDPIRYTNGDAGTNWVDFAPIINAANDKLFQTLALLPFRGRLVAFNTSEGSAFPGLRFGNRIRWAAIGNPFTEVSPIVNTVSVDAWRDDIRGKGGFLDIPTNEDIISVGFVRDNLVIYCEQSTWQLRYTGRSIAPFQIEKVNSELGSTSTFSSIQFDTSLVGIGDKGIVECDSFKSERIDIKIPDFTFHIQELNNGEKRIHGIRDFVKRLAYWTYPSESANGIYPDRRLCYNYENDSWAIFTDSLTTLGNFYLNESRKWINTHIPWIECNFPWISQPAGDPLIVGGNQQGFIEILDQQTTNDPGLFIENIVGNNPNPTVVTSPSHNLQTGQIIKISDIPTGTPFATSLNDNVFNVIVLNADSFQLTMYNPINGQFNIPHISTEINFVGYGLISVRDNFIIQSKKFNFLDDGQSIQIGYIDILMNATEQENGGAISLNMLLDYNDYNPTNTTPNNDIADGTAVETLDTFFNSIIPTYPPILNKVGGYKFWQRVFCATRGSFLTLQYTFNNAQMAGIEQELDVQIDSQIVWMRRAGRINPM